MGRHAVLNNVDHRDLRIITTRSAAFGDNVMSTVTFPAEFRHVQAHYPIFFRKHTETGRFEPVAIFGFRNGENLFLGADGWDATYVPMMIERQPFLIGFEVAGDDGRTVIHVDMDSPRVSTKEGEAVFLAHGGVSDYLERIKSMLHAIHQGMESIPPFIEMLVGFDLLESFTLDVALKDGSEFRMAGFYTIHEEKLDQLDGNALADLNRRGYLKAIYLVIASMSNIRLLIERKNRNLAR